MKELNPIAVTIGLMMYVIPLGVVLVAITSCCYILYRHRKLEEKYINQNKLLETLELDNLNISDESSNDLNISDQSSIDLNVSGEDVGELFTV